MTCNIRVAFSGCHTSFCVHCLECIKLPLACFCWHVFSIGLHTTTSSHNNIALPHASVGMALNEPAQCDNIDTSPCCHSISTTQQRRYCSLIPSALQWGCASLFCTQLTLMHMRFTHFDLHQLSNYRGYQSPSF